MRDLRPSFLDRLCPGVDAAVACGMDAGVMGWWVGFFHSEPQCRLDSPRLFRTVLRTHPVDLSTMSRGVGQMRGYPPEIWFFALFFLSEYFRAASRHTCRRSTYVEMCHTGAGASGKNARSKPSFTAPQKNPRRLRGGSKPRGGMEAHRGDAAIERRRRLYL